MSQFLEKPLTNGQTEKRTNELTQVKLLDLSGEIGSSRKACLSGNLFCFIGDLRIKNNHLQFDKNYKDTYSAELELK